MTHPLSAGPVLELSVTPRGVRQRASAQRAPRTRPAAPLWKLTWALGMQKIWPSVTVMAGEKYLPALEPSALEPAIPGLPQQAEGPRTWPASAGSSSWKQNSSHLLPHHGAKLARAGGTLDGDTSSRGTVWHSRCPGEEKHLNRRLFRRLPGSWGTRAAQTRTQGCARGLRQQRRSPPRDRPRYDLSWLSPGLPAGNQALGDAPSELGGGVGVRSRTEPGGVHRGPTCRRRARHSHRRL